MTGRHLLRRAVTSLGMLFVLSLVVFAVLRLIPGDPTSVRTTDTRLTQAEVERIRQSLGLDASIPTQYVRWAEGVVRGDFGESYFSEFPVTTLVNQRVGATLELVIAAMVLGLLISVPLAVLGALKPRSRLDQGIALGTTLGISIPPFCIGLLLLVVFAVNLGWLPTRGYVSFADDPVENLRFLILPAVTLGIAVAAPVTRYLRATIAEELRADYVRAARAKGLSRTAVVMRHALPNGLLPTLNVLGVIVATLLGGAVVIEYVFGWPGLGALALESVQTRDYPILQAVVMLAALVFVLVTFVVDVVSHMIDPRLRVEAS